MILEVFPNLNDSMITSATPKPHPGVTQAGQCPLLTWRRALYGVKAPVAGSRAWARVGRAAVALSSGSLGASPEPQRPSSGAPRLPRDVNRSTGGNSRQKSGLDLNQHTNVDTSRSQQGSWSLTRWRNLLTSINSRLQPFFFIRFLLFRYVQRCRTPLGIGKGKAC